LRSIVTTFQINNCIAEVKNPNKFSTIANWNPEIILVDQLAMILRYIYKKRDIVVQVFCFVPSISHTSKHEVKITWLLIRHAVELSWYEFWKCCKNGGKVLRLTCTTWPRVRRPYLQLFAMIH
jgi:hypothetical protein